MMWMGDMLLSHESNEMILDSQSGSPFFNDSPHPLEDMRGRVPLVSGNIRYIYIYLNGPVVCDCTIVDSTLKFINPLYILSKIICT